MDLEAVRDEFAERARPLMEALHIPGIAMGIVHGDQEITAGLGITSLENPLPVTDTTLFRIASNTKPFTATALMRKVDDGSLDLDAPLQRYLPDFELANPEWARQVTPRHLLTHAAGFGDLSPDDARFGDGDDALERLIEAMPTVPVEMPPGTEFNYSNTGIALAGRLLEVLSDRSYDDAIRQLVLEPLGLGNTFLRPEEVITRRFAVGHVHASLAEPPRVARHWGVPRFISPAGAICSDVRNLLRWARFHLGDGTTPDGERLLRPETMQQMQSPQLEVSEWGTIGLPWMLGQYGGARRIGHGGFWNAQSSPFDLFPEHEFALVLMANADTAAVALPQLTSLVLERVLGLEDSDPKPIEVPSAALAEYVGTYQDESMAVDVRLEDSKLLATTRWIVRPQSWESGLEMPPTSLTFFRKDCVLGSGGHPMLARGAFIRNTEGRVHWLRWMGSLRRKAAP